MAARPKKTSRPRRSAGPARKSAKVARLPDELPAVTDEEALDLLKAIDAYKRRTGRAFPSWTEVLQIVKALGYEKRTV